MPNNTYEKQDTKHKIYQTEAEQHWRGAGGNAWTERSWDNKILASKTSLFSKLLNKTKGIKSVLEFGPNMGQSMWAIKTLLPDVSCCGIEINHEAAQ